MNLAPTAPAGRLLIRASRPADLAQIQAIYAAEVRGGTASFELEPPDLGEMRRRRETILDGGFPYLVAEFEERVAGYAYATAYRPRPAYRHTVENSVYVARRAWRRGIGLRLLRALVDACRERGFRQMVAVIGDAEHLASIRLHEKAGFRMVGTLADVGRKFERWLDIVVMQRALDDPAP